MISVAFLEDWWAWNVVFRPPQLPQWTSCWQCSQSGGASCCHSWNQSIVVQLTMAGNFWAIFLSVALVGEKQNDLRRGGRGKGEKITPQQLEAIKDRHAMNHGLVLASAPRGSRPKLAVNKFHQLPCTYRFYCLSAVQTQLPSPLSWFQLG